MFKFYVIRHTKSRIYTGYGKPAKFAPAFEIKVVEADTAAEAATKAWKRGKLVVFRESSGVFLQAKTVAAVEDWEPEVEPADA